MTVTDLGEGRDWEEGPCYTAEPDSGTEGSGKVHWEMRHIWQEVVIATPRCQGDQLH